MYPRVVFLGTSTSRRIDKGQVMLNKALQPTREAWAWGQVLNCESTQLPCLTRVYN